jgi:hypothetical protein
MKLCGLIPNFYIHVSGSNLYILSQSVLFEISIFIYSIRKLSLNRWSEEKGRELPLSRGWQQFPALPTAPAVEPRIHINDQDINFQFRKLWIINRNN